MIGVGQVKGSCDGGFGFSLEKAHMGDKDSAFFNFILNLAKLKDRYVWCG